MTVSNDHKIAMKLKLGPWADPAGSCLWTDLPASRPTRRPPGFLPRAGKLVARLRRLGALLKPRQPG